MGYFSNGSEGMDYQSEYCHDCVNHRDKQDERGYGCAIWDLQLFEASEIEGYIDIDKVLNHFIPREGCNNEQCEMYLTYQDVKTDIEIEQNKKQLKLGDS